MPGQRKVPFIVFGLLECVFLSYFTKKMAITQKEITSPEKITLVQKTTYKKLVLKYRDNARFPSMCLASENAFLTYIFTQKRS